MSSRGTTAHCLAIRSLIAFLAASLLVGLLGIGTSQAAVPTVAPSAAPAVAPGGTDDGVRGLWRSKTVGQSLPIISASRTDAAGNVYAALDSPAGSSEYIDPAGVKTTFPDQAIAKLTPNGVVVWIRDITGWQVRDLDVTSAGVVFFSGQSPVGSAAIQRRAGDGTFEWEHAIANSGSGIDVSADGSVLYTAGRGGIGPGITRTDPATGSPIWFHRLGIDTGPFSKFFTDVAITGDGGAVAVGWVQVALTLGDNGEEGTKTDPTKGPVMTAKWNGAGARQWYRQDGGVQAGPAVEVAPTPDGNVVVAGTVARNGKVGNTPYPVTAYFDTFLAKVASTDGQVTWSRWLETDGDALKSESSEPADLDVHPTTGSIAVIGVYATTMTLREPAGNIVLEPGIGQTFTAVFNSNGTARWARLSTPGGNVDRNVSFFPDGDVLMSAGYGQWPTVAKGPGAFSIESYGFHIGSWMVRMDVGAVRPYRPEPATDVHAVADGAGVARVRWKPTTDNGGSPITHYKVMSLFQDRTWTVPVSQTDIRITDLVNGGVYYFAVRTINAKGESADSALSEAVTAIDDFARDSYNPLSLPTRIYDTRDGTGPAPHALGPGETVEIFVDRFSPQIGWATGVALNVTAVNPTTDTHLSLWAADRQYLGTSNLNAPANKVVPNMVMVRVSQYGPGNSGAAGYIKVRNNSGTTHVVIDMLGWFDGRGWGGLTTPTSPTRALDTRFGTGVPTGRIGSGQKADFKVTGVGGVPTNGAESVILNVTGVGPSTATHLAADASGNPGRPGTSNLNLDKGQTSANMVVVKIGGNGRVAIWNNSGDIDIVADIVGWIGPQRFGGGTVANQETVDPVRMLDTRTGFGAPVGAVGPGGVITLEIANRPEMGHGTEPVRAVYLNIVVVGPTAPTHLTVWPSGEARPNASSINVVGGETRANLVLAKVGTDGKVKIFNNAGNVHIVADMVGWLGIPA